MNTMIDLLKALEALGKEDTGIRLSRGDTELIELKFSGKDINLEIKDREGFKKLLKEIKSWKS